MNLINFSDLAQKDVNRIFTIADDLIENQEKYSKSLDGKHFVLFFPESSIRTRLTFEKGILTLGGTCSLFPPTALDKKEKTEDTVKYMTNWVDAIIVRHSNHEMVKEIAKHSSVPVINGMTSACHPCEILTDLYSLNKLYGNYKDLTYTFVGEDANISKTWVEAAETLDFKLNHVFFETDRIKLDNKNYSFFTDLDKVIKRTNVILTDPAPSEKKTTAYYENYQITMDVMKKAPSNAVVNPCPPFYRNEEIQSEIITSDYFVGYDFKKNLLYVQQAVILYCLGLA